MSTFLSIPVILTQMTRFSRSPTFCPKSYTLTVGAIVSTLLPMPVVLFDPSKTWSEIFLVVFLPTIAHTVESPPSPSSTSNRIPIDSPRAIEA